MQFQNPHILYFLVLALLPIIIYLLKLRQHKTVYYSNVSLLKSIHKQQKKKRSLIDLLILLCRVLAIVVLVLAFAKPTVEDSNSVQADQNIVFYIDNSFSMEAMGENGVLIEQAKTIVLDYVQALPSSSHYALMTNATKGNTLQFSSKETLISKIANIDLHPQQKSLQSIVSSLQTIEKSGVDINALFCLSDFQKAEKDEAVVCSEFTITPIRLVAENRSSLSIDSVRFDEPIHRPNQAEKITIFASNYSNNEYNDIPVRLFLNDSLKGFSTVSIEPNSSSEFELGYSNSKSGIHKLRIELDDFPIQFDNTYYESYTIQEKINVLSISNAEQPTAMELLFSKDENFNIISQPSTLVTNEQIENASLIILTELDHIESGIQTQLIRFVEQGGRLAIFPKQELDITKSNRFLSQLGIYRLKSLQSDPIRLGAANLENSLYNDVFKQKSRKGIAPSITSYWTFTPNTSLPSETILSLANEVPLFAQFWREKGSILLSGFSISDKENAFASHPLSVSLFYNIALTSQQVESYTYTIGREKNAVINSLNTLANIELAEEGDALKKWKPEIKQTNQGYYLLSLHNLLTSGFYTVNEQSKPITSLALNYMRVESTNSFLSKEELESMVSQASINWDYFDASSNLLNETTEGQRMLSTWQKLLLLALVLLFCEQVLLSRLVRK